MLAIFGGLIVDLSLDAEQTGVRIIEMPWRRRMATRRWLRRAHICIAQLATNYVVSRAVARLDDPVALAREIEFWRRLGRRDHAASITHGAIGAIQVASPMHGLASPPVPADWFAPVRGESEGYVFYVHGGSFVFERGPAVTDLVGRLAAGADARVFAPNYRLAPEHPCPAAVDDVVAAYRWLLRNTHNVRVVALAESAGCAILLAALQRLRDEGDNLPAGVLLLSPWVDLSLQSWSIIAASLAGTDGSTMLALGVMAHLYLDGRPASDPVASPLFGDFAGLPPMTIHAAKDDLLYDDAVRLAERVRDVGGDLTVRLWSEEGHVWEKSQTPKARQSIELASQFIALRLRAESRPQ